VVGSVGACDPRAHATRTAAGSLYLPAFRSLCQQLVAVPRVTLLWSAWCMGWPWVLPSVMHRFTEPGPSSKTGEQSHLRSAAVRGWARRRRRRARGSRRPPRQRPPRRAPCSSRRPRRRRRLRPRRRKRSRMPRAATAPPCAASRRALRPAPLSWRGGAGRAWRPRRRAPASPALRRCSWAERRQPQQGVCPNSARARRDLPLRPIETGPPARHAQHSVRRGAPLALGAA